MNIDKDKLILADALLREHFERIKDWAVGDIRKCCRMRQDGTCEDNGSLVGAFILWCCAIDYFGGMLTGDTYVTERGTRSRITAFVEKYLKRYAKYDSKKIIDLRWSLIHYYSPLHFFLEHDSNKRKYHLKKTNKGYLLHLGSAIEDLEKAVADYSTDLWNKPNLRINAFKYYKKNPMIKPIDFNKVVFTDENCD